jgi:hypothetical protein
VDEMDGPVNKVIPIEIVSTCSLSDIFRFANIYSVVFVGDSILSLRYMYDNIKDSVCICLSRDANTITNLCLELQSMGAKALIVTVLPLPVSIALASFLIFRVDIELISGIPFFTAKRVNCQLFVNMNKPDALEIKS